MKNAFDLRPEQWALFGALLFLGGLAVFKALTLPNLEAAFSPGKQKQPDSFDSAQIEDLNERWQTAPSIPYGDHKVFVSRLIVYQPATGEVGYLAPEEEGPDGIRIAWKEKYSFPLEDPTVAESDPDQDGFSNIEEYQAGTDPRDTESHPPFVKKLCVSDYEYIPFRLIFRGYSPSARGEGLVYQINLLDVKRRSTRMMEKGQDLEGYTIGEFRKKIEDRFNPSTGITEQVDVSELDIINPVLDETITLVLNQEIESDESRVQFKLNVPGKSPEPANLRRGEKFTIDGIEFQLVKATADSAVVKMTENGETIEVPKCQ